MVAVLLDNAEHALRGRMARYTGRDRPLRDPDAIGVERYLLGGHIDDDLLRALRDLAKAGILFDLGLVRPRRRSVPIPSDRTDPAGLHIQRGVKAVAAIARS